MKLANRSTGQNYSERQDLTMDPNSTLAALRQWVEQWSPETDMEEQALEAFNALDEWLSKGGFLPSAWER